VIEDAVKARLLGESAVTALVEARIYPQLPQNPVLPTITFQRVGLRTGRKLVSPARRIAYRENLRRAYIQIDSWAKTYSGARQVSAAVCAALDEWCGDGIAEARLDTERDFFETDAEIHRVSQDFIVWGRE
jgi:hypothetical protein